MSCYMITPHNNYNNEIENDNKALKAILPILLNYRMMLDP